MDFFIRRIDLKLAESFPFTKHGLAHDVFSLLNSPFLSWPSFQAALQSVRSMQ